MTVLRPEWVFVGLMSVRLYYSIYTYQQSLEVNRLLVIIQNR